MLLLETPRRLSTDIDILVQPGIALDAYLEKASAIFPFEKVEEQVRIGKNAIEKRHFKFTYQSPTYQKPFYILLDVLFEENHYTQTISKKIDSDLLLTQASDEVVEVPSAEVAAIRASKVMYLLMCILTDHAFTPIEDASRYMNDTLLQPSLLPLRYLKKVNPQAYGYLIKTDELMSHALSV